ncbi:unnamed protein product [Mycena citricolor]|uniref:FAD-binding PCMH-type domain-containing protein n=1 Tax=Mycena citricolor TaxID=2018698 RepID=A0AAD2Q6E5_9AGAR|nr:unnamed protein product [Mycena citricolor]
MLSCADQLSQRDISDCSVLRIHGCKSPPSPAPYYQLTSVQTQNEGCASIDQQCVLDWQNATNPAAFQAPQRCYQGSIAPYYIDVQRAADVKAAFKFSSDYGVPLVIKNTGHDFNGRSSKIGSLGLWSHNLKSMSYSSKFKPHGSSGVTYSAVTIGAGVEGIETYQFADQHGITLPGGACPTVGSAGGYLQLAVQHTWLAVDRVLEFEVVTPNGQHLFANAHQNQDLYFALRGGGGGTFGFVMAATMKALPKTSYGRVGLQWELDYPPDVLVVFDLERGPMVQRRLEWTDTSELFLVITCYVIELVSAYGQDRTSATNVTVAEATAYMAPMAALAKKLGGTFSIGATKSYLDFHNTYIVPDTATELDGLPQTISTRLVPAETFSTNATALLASITAMVQALPVSFIFANAPYGFKQDPALGPTSVTPAWRSSIWHVVGGAGWAYNTPSSLQRGIYANLTGAVDPIRAITPSGGAYQNEADVHEANHEGLSILISASPPPLIASAESFWGRDNYAKLLAIKNKYDPDHLLDCWHCVGWKGVSDSQYRCYV